jgi:hypothetical protein
MLNIVTSVCTVVLAELGSGCTIDLNKKLSQNNEKLMSCGDFCGYVGEQQTNNCYYGMVWVVRMYIPFACLSHYF